MQVITERQQAMLEFERTFWTFDEPKESVIRARFQCSADEYYAELNELLEHPWLHDRSDVDFFAVVERLTETPIAPPVSLAKSGTSAQADLATSRSHGCDVSASPAPRP